REIGAELTLDVEPSFAILGRAQEHERRQEDQANDDEVAQHQLEVQRYVHWIVARRTNDDYLAGAPPCNGAGVLDTPLLCTESAPDDWLVRANRVRSFECLHAHSQCRPSAEAGRSAWRKAKHAASHPNKRALASRAI